MHFTLARLATELLDDANLNQLTRKSYQGTLTPFVEQYGSCLIEQITRANIEKYLLSLTHLSFRTHNKHQTIIKRLFSYAVERGYLTHNPATHIRRKKPDSNKGEHGDDQPVRYLSTEELKLLYKSIKHIPRLYALVALIHQSGARISEILALNLAQINFAEREFQVVGKGNKKRWCYFGKTALSALEIYIEKHREHPYKALFTERHVFKRYVRRLSYDSAYREFKEALLGQQELRSINFHHLRHTFATERAQVVPLEVLRALLGHENIQTTLIYQKITSQVAKEAAHNALNKINL